MNNKHPSTLLTIAAGALVIALATACSDEERRALGEIDVQEALATQVQTALTERGFELDGSLDCSSDITADGAVTGSCTGTTTTGAATSGTVTGTGDVEAGMCRGHLVIDVDGDVARDELDADCFATD